MKDKCLKRYCYLCDSNNCKILINSLSDYVTNSNFKNGSFWRCLECEFVFQDNPPEGEHILAAYKDYYTQKKVKHLDCFMGDKRFKILKSFYKGFYLNKKNLVYYLILIFIKLACAVIT